VRLKTIVIAGVCLALLLAALTWLDIRLASSRMASDSTVAASHSPTGAVPSVAVTGLSVEGNDRMQRSLNTELREALAGLQGIGEIMTAGGDRQANSAAVEVSFVERQVFWTPFYARSQLRVHVAYASDGDTSFDDAGESAHFTSSPGSPPAVKFLASYNLADVSWGLISQAGYQNYLAEQIAARVKGSVQEQMKQDQSGL
jgi:hypothetical protein